MTSADVDGGTIFKRLEVASSATYLALLLKVKRLLPSQIFSVGSYSSLMTSIIAHRGNRSAFPENTGAAFESALKLKGVSGIEFDGELCSDGIIILHQETLGPNENFTGLRPLARAPGRNWTEGHTIEELKKLDAGSWFGKKACSRQSLLTLEEVLRLHWGGVRAYFELKSARYFTQSETPLEFAQRFLSLCVPPVTDFLARGGLLSFVSFCPRMLSHAKEFFPHVERVLDVWLDRSDKKDEVLRDARLCGASVLSLAEHMVLSDPSWISLSRKHGLKCVTYPVSPAYGEREENEWTAEKRTPTWQRLFSLQPPLDGVMTDFPEELLKFLQIR